MCDPFVEPTGGTKGRSCGGPGGPGGPKGPRGPPIGGPFTELTVGATGGPTGDTAGGPVGGPLRRVTGGRLGAMGSPFAAPEVLIGGGGGNIVK